MRLFVAVEIENREVLNRIIEVRNSLPTCINRKALKPVKDENLHITLRFIGEINEEFIPEIIECLKKVEALKPFIIEVKEVGAFPSLSRARVIWVGVGKGSKRLEIIKKLLDPCLNNFAKPERNPYTPHITLARVKGRVNLKCLEELLNSFSNKVFGYSEVRGVKLKKSILKPEGPIYSDIYVAQLKGG